MGGAVQFLIAEPLLFLKILVGQQARQLAADEGAFPGHVHRLLQGGGQLGEGPFLLRAGKVFVHRGGQLQGFFDAVQAGGQNQIIWLRFCRLQVTYRGAS